jgi:hypothetical protein
MSRRKKIIQKMETVFWKIYFLTLNTALEKKYMKNLRGIAE